MSDKTVTELLDELKLYGIIPRDTAYDVALAAIIEKVRGMEKSLAGVLDICAEYANTGSPYARGMSAKILATIQPSETP